MHTDITSERQVTRDAQETTEETRSLAFAHRGLIATCIVAGMALVLLTVWLGERLYRSYVYVVDEPKLVVPGGKLSDWENSNIELFRVASASVAYITTEQLRFNPFRGASVAQGAGFVWDKAGHVVTNFHVIEGADTVYVQLQAGDPMSARVLGGTPEYDIAVVRLRNPPRDRQPLPIGTSKNLTVGQATFAIGNPQILLPRLRTAQSSMAADAY